MTKQVRPDLGSRMLVAALAEDLLRGVLKDLQHWTSERRRCAARLFRIVLLLCEGTSVAHLPRTLQALCMGLGAHCAIPLMCHTVKSGAINVGNH
jgi:hypothetical protein